MMRTVFVGNSSIAEPVLNVLLKRTSLSLVFGHSAKPQGRRREIKPSWLGQWASTHGVAYAHGRDIHDSQACARINAASPDLLVVMAFGQILRDSVLSIPTKAAVNIHVSLLPRYRGASPIQAALLSGDTKTGVTIQRMSRTLDSGHILLQHTIPIKDKMYTEGLERDVSLAAAQSLSQFFDRVAENDPHIWSGIAQDEQNVTWCKKISVADAYLDFTKSACDLEREIRAFSSWPRSRCLFRGQQLIVHRASAILCPDIPSSVPGELVAIGDERLYAVCGDGWHLSLEELQLSGKKRMEAGPFCRGMRPIIGECLSPLQSESGK